MNAAGPQFLRQERPLLVPDYFNMLVKKLERAFPEDDPGSAPGYFLASEYISRDNKRRVTFFVSHGPPASARVVTEVGYVFPVSADAAPLFKLEGVQPAGEPVFFEMTVPAGQTVAEMVAAYASGRNLALWESEVQRISAAKATAPAKLKQAMHNVLVYWRDMKSRLYDAVYSADIRLVRTSSGRTPSSERLRRSRRTSSTRSNPRVSLSARRSSSRSRKSVSRPSTRRQRRLNLPIEARKDPEPGSYKSNSDPK